MKVLLTGATGFIGRHVIEPLLKSGFEVHAAYFGPQGEPEPNLYWHECNLLDPASQQELLDKVNPSHLLHFAWYAIPGKYWTAPENLHWVSATLSLVEKFVKQGGKRVVCAGTCAEYNWDNGLCSENSTPLEPTTLYGNAKASLFRLLKSYTQVNHISFAWGRIFFLYGSHEPETRLVSAAITHLLRGEDVKCSHGEQVRDFLHVQDIADAFSLLLQSDVQGAINIASGESYSLKEVIQLVDNKIKSAGKPLFGALPTQPNDPPTILADVAKLRTELGFQPAFSLSERLDQTIAWWNEKK